MQPEVPGEVTILSLSNHSSYSSERIDLHTRPHTLLLFRSYACWCISSISRAPLAAPRTFRGGVFFLLWWDYSPEAPAHMPHPPHTPVMPPPRPNATQLSKYYARSAKAHAPAHHAITCNATHRGLVGRPTAVGTRKALAQLDGTTGFRSPASAAPALSMVSIVRSFSNVSTSRDTVRPPSNQRRSRWGQRRPSPRLVDEG